MTSRDATIRHLSTLLRERDEECACLRQELARVEAVLVAADRIHDAYEAMLEKRDIGRLPEWERASLGEGEGGR